jgi:hypothetical protein
MTYFVKFPQKYRRKRFHNGQHTKPASVFSFGTEKEAIDFANEFKACRVEVSHLGQVIYQNWSTPVWIHSVSKDQIERSY